MRTYHRRRTYDQAFKQEPVRFVFEEGRKAGIGSLPHQLSAESNEYRYRRRDH